MIDPNTRSESELDLIVFNPWVWRDIPEFPSKIMRILTRTELINRAYSSAKINHHFSYRSTTFSPSLQGEKGEMRERVSLPVDMIVTTSSLACTFCNSCAFFSTSARPLKAPVSCFPTSEVESSAMAWENSPVARETSIWLSQNKSTNPRPQLIRVFFDMWRTSTLFTNEVYWLHKSSEMKFQTIEIWFLLIEPLNHEKEKKKYVSVLGFQDWVRVTSSVS